MKLSGIILVLILLSFFCGCSMSPAYKRPIVNLDSSYSDSNSVNINDGDFNSIGWWLNFADPITTELVDKGLKNNYDLAASSARIKQSIAELESAAGKQLPELNYNFSRDRAKNHTTINGQDISSISTNYYHNITVSYALDLFGKLSSLKKAALAEHLAVKSNSLALTNTVIASIINARIQISTLAHQNKILKQTIQSRQQTLEIIDRRYRNGRVDSIDVRLARDNLAVSKAAQEQVNLVLQLSQHNLDLLIGERIGANRNLQSWLSDLPDLQPIPAGIPAGLLDRRPDLIAAEQSLIAQNQRIGASIAQLLPDFTLTGSYGFRSDKFDNLADNDFEVYSFLIRAAQPLFRGGQLKAQVKYNKAKFEELAANYSKLVLNALKEVEDALVTEKSLLEQLKYQKIRFEETSKAEKLSLERYSLGLEPLLTYLESERRRITAENDLIVLKGNLWSNRVNLFLALGGNWIE